MFYMIIEGAAGERHFGYAHLFRNLLEHEFKVGDFWEEGPTGREMAIFREATNRFIIINMDPANRYALASSEITRDTITYKGVLYNIQSNVTPTMPLAILGDSGPGGIHLHIYAYRDIVQAVASFQDLHNCYDPIAVIDYEHEIGGTPTQYSCTFEAHEIKYGDSHNSYFKVRPRMNGANTGLTYSSAVMDVDLVELFITPEYSAPEAVELWGSSNSAYQYYRGEYYESRINQGGRINITPNSIYPFGNNGGITVREPLAGPTKTKLAPHAYRSVTEGYPWDDYWFSDFYPRIDKNHTLTTTKILAPHNLRARYLDGNYHAHIRVKTSKGNIFSSSTNDPDFAAPDTLKFAIDNFLPFVQKVVAYNPGSLPHMYMREWKPLTNGNFVFDPEPVVWLDKAAITVIVHTSEAMSKVSLRVNNCFLEETQASNEEMTEWTFQVQADFWVDKAINQLEINGLDLHNNPVQKNAQTIPIRQSTDNSWSPQPNYGNDVNHEIQIGTPDVDFTAEQLGTGAYQFTASSPHTVYQYNWSFGDGSACSNCAPQVEYTYPSTGVYMATLSVLSSGGNFNIEKEVIVQQLTPPEPDFTAAPKINTGGRDGDVVVTVDFYDNTTGIVLDYSWDFGNGETSTERNPEGIIFQPNTNYNVSLTATNISGGNTITKPQYYDPDSSPWANIIAWRQTPNYWDFDVSVTNLDPPYTYYIDYGDGFYETANDEDHVHRFSHYYNAYGSYEISASVSGTDQSGQINTAYFATVINAQADDLLIELMDITGPGDKYPYTDVVIQPVLANSSGFNDTTKFSFGYVITKVGDPMFHKLINKTHWGADFPPHIFQFEEEGEYQLHLVLFASGNLWSGHAYMQIVIVNAPKYISAAICCQPYQVCLGSNKTYSGSIWPIENPGINEQYWYPTNVRWTLFDDQGEIAATKEEQFPTIEFHFEKWFTHNYDREITYTLRLETWNNQHGYENDTLLDPKYVNTISFYDYDEKEITVSANMAALELVTDNYGYFTFNADGEPVWSSTFQISNPGLLPADWYVEVPSAYLDWIQASPAFGSNLSNGNSVTIEIGVSPNTNEGTRYGYINIHAMDNQGNPVQGSPAWVQLEQWGVEGPPAELICGDNSNQQFGYAVSVDGTTAAIGAPGKNANDPSSAFIYEKNHIGQWVKKANLIEPTGQKHFGRSIAIHGEYVIASSSWNAAIYKRPGAGWSGNIYPLKVLENNITNSDYGISVAIWGDYAIVGDRKHGSSDRGCVYIYYRNQGGADQWGRLKQLYGQSNNDFFGTSVSIYNDLLAVGAPQQDNNSGYIDVYYRNLNEPWTLEKRILAPLSSDIGPDVKFGTTVSLFEDRLATFYNSRSTDGLKHYDNWALFHRGNYRNWPLFAKDGGNNYYNIGKTFSSIALYKDFDLSLETPYQYHFLSGAPDRFFTNTTIDFGIAARSSFIKHYSTTLLKTNEWLEHVFFNTISPGSSYGQSVALSYLSKIVSASAYQNTGCVVIRNHAKKTSLCDAGIDLVLENFTKPAGQYEPVVAQNITIGGNNMPAVYQPGSDVSYYGEEIVLKGGFLAMDGTIFEAVAEDCYVPEEEKSVITASDWVLGIKIDQDRILDSLQMNYQDKLLGITDVFKRFTHKHPGFPWQRFNLFAEQNSLGIYDQNFNTLAIERNLSPYLMIDFSFTSEGYFLIFEAKDEETDRVYKFLISP